MTLVFRHFESFCVLLAHRMQQKTMFCILEQRKLSLISVLKSADFFVVARASKRLCIDTFVIMIRYYSHSQPIHCQWFFVAHSDWLTFSSKRTIWIRVSLDQFQFCWFVRFCILSPCRNIVRLNISLFMILWMVKV